MQYGHSAYVKFGNPDFVKLAESMGLIGYRVQSAEELLPTLKMAIQQKVPTVIDVPVDYRENIEFSRKQGEVFCPI
jgi:acetolactate synthase-1/2/3 large subunit